MRKSNRAQTNIFLVVGQEVGGRRQCHIIKCLSSFPALSLSLDVDDLNKFQNKNKIIKTAKEKNYPRAENRFGKHHLR